MNFKTLKAFFGLEQSAEEAETTETTETTVETPAETEGDAVETTEEEAPQAAVPTIGGVAVDQARVDALVGAELALVSANAELFKFGATSADRAKFLSESRQLYTWYENQKAINTTPRADANTEQKTKAKKVHPGTAKAIELQAK